MWAVSKIPRRFPAYLYQTGESYRAQKMIDYLHANAVLLYSVSDAGGSLIIGWRYFQGKRLHQAVIASNREDQSCLHDALIQVYRLTTGSRSAFEISRPASPYSLLIVPVSG